MVWAYTLISVVIVSLVSLIGVFTLAFNDKLIRKILLFFVAFSSGALIGDTFLHLLPETIEKNDFSASAAFSLFAGILCFFLLEKILRWRHCHEINCDDHPKHLGTMNLVGDAAHNLIDGILIAASFIVSFPLGVATTTAVVLHEIPQELSDFGVLLHSGFSKKRAILFNLLSALFALVGAVFALLLGESVSGFADLIIPLAAGGFLYIALSDLIPELHKEERFQNNLLQFVFIIAGIFVMYLLLFLE